MDHSPNQSVVWGKTTLEDAKSYAVDIEEFMKKVGGAAAPVGAAAAARSP